MILKVSISSVEWCFFTWYGRKVDFSRLFFHRMWKIYFHLKVKKVILYNMLYQKNVKVSVKAILTTRISKYWKLKNSSKRLYMRPNAFNRQFLIIPVKIYQKVMLSNQYTTKKKVILKLTFWKLWSKCTFLKILHFWVQHIMSYKMSSLTSKWKYIFQW